MYDGSNKRILVLAACFLSKCGIVRVRDQVIDCFLCQTFNLTKKFYDLS